MQPYDVNANTISQVHMLALSKIVRRKPLEISGKVSLFFF
jgi:hypothetical protein